MLLPWNNGEFGHAVAFVPDSLVSTGVPSHINLGNFTLVCVTCTSTGLGSTFGAFDLALTDQTDGNAVGTFVGTSPGIAAGVHVVPLILSARTMNRLGAGPTK